MEKITIAEIDWHNVCYLRNKELHRWWDPAPKNVAHWRRHLVALDFTDRFYDGASYPVRWKLRK